MATVYIHIKSRISLIMGQIEPEHVYTLAYMQILTKHGHSIYTHKVSDEFDYGANRNRTSGVIYP